MTSCVSVSLSTWATILYYDLSSLKSYLINLLKSLSNSADIIYLLKSKLKTLGDQCVKSVQCSGAYL